MRVLGIFILLILTALLLSALINYPLYLLLDGSMDAGPHKLINTTGKLIAIPGFILIVRHFAVANKNGLGYGLPRPEFLRELLRGWLSGLLILLALSAALLIFGVRVFKPTPDDLGYLLFKALFVAFIGGFLIGFIEETFFRGGIFSAIRKRSSFLTTLLLSSLFYAAMHFIKPLPLPQGDAFAWNSGLQMLAGAFDQLGELRSFDSLLAIFVLGAFLALVRERTGNIAYVIGLHASFVMVIKMMKSFTAIDPQSPANFLVGHYDGIVGLLSAAGLFIHLLLVFFFWRRPQQG